MEDGRRYYLIVGAKEEEDAVIDSLILLEIGLERQGLEHQRKHLHHEQYPSTRHRSAVKPVGSMYVFKWDRIGRDEDQSCDCTAHVVT